MMKLPAPTSNLQRSTKPQAPIEAGRRGVGVWNLDVLWSLELGAGNF
jgi:hypothetical protein